MKCRYCSQEYAETEFVGKRGRIVMSCNRCRERAASRKELERLESKATIRAKNNCSVCGGVATDRDMSTGEHSDHSAKKGFLVVLRGSQYCSDCLAEAEPSKSSTDRSNWRIDDPNKDYWGCVALWQAVAEQAEKDGVVWP